jgi:hypothetical protein
MIITGLCFEKMTGEHLVPFSGMADLMRSLPRYSLLEQVPQSAHQDFLLEF